MRKSFYLPGLLAFCFILFSTAVRAITIGPPTIKSNPVNATIYVGDTAHFIVTAIDTPSLETMSYVWQVSTDAGATWSDVGPGTLSSDTSSNLSVVALSTLQDGNLYRCIVFNLTESDTSSVAMLSVLAGSSLTIVTNPANAIAVTGFPVSFSVSAIDTPSLEAMNYDWQVSTDGGTSWTDLTSTFGGTTSSVSFTASLPQNGNMYRCVVSNTVGADTSSAAALTVIVGDPPTIVSNPRDTTVCVTASSVSFSVIAVDPPASLPMHYSWFESFDGGVTWDSVLHDFDTADITGMRSATLTLLNPTGGLLFWDAAEFMAVVGTDSGMVSSTAATLHIDLPNAGTISGPTAVCLGSTITLTSDIAGGTWSNYHHAIDTVDASGDVYGIAPGTDTVLYTVTNTCGPVATAAFITVDTLLTGQPISGPTATCIGRVIDLTDPVPGGVWSSSGVYAYVNPSGMVDGVSTGFETIHYVISDACNTVDETYEVRVDAVIDPGTISGPSTVCAGSWVSFTATGEEGIWLTSSSAIAIVDGDGNVTGVSDGVAIISYYFSNACGVSAATDTLVVSAPASPIGGIDSVGIGFTRLLTDSSAGGTWASADASIATVGSTTGIVTGVSAGSVIIGYTVTNSCGTSTASVIMLVGTSSVTAITGADTVCIGRTITLSDPVSGGVWSTATDTVVSVDATGLVTGVADGLGEITYTVTTGFGPASVTKTIVVLDDHVDSLHIPNIFSESGSYTFVGYPTGGTWTSSNPSVGNFIGTPGFFVIYGYGSTTIRYSVNTYCGPADTTFVITMTQPAGIKQTNGGISSLNVYPNPSTGDFTVNLVTGITEPAVVTVTNMVGEKVKEFTINTNQSAELSLDQPDGVYFISTETSTGKYSAKITITR